MQRNEIEVDRTDDTHLMSRALQQMLERLDAPADYWDRPHGNWGTCAAAEDVDQFALQRAERRREANSAYRLGSKALHRDDLCLAQRWFTLACEQQHPGAAFRSAVVCLRTSGRPTCPAPTGVRTATLGGAIQHLVDAARWGHRDARHLLTDNGGWYYQGIIDIRCSPFPSGGSPTSETSIAAADTPGDESYTPQDPQFYREVRDALRATAPYSPTRQPGRHRRSPTTPATRPSTWSAAPLRHPSLTHAAQQVPVDHEPPASLHTAQRALRVLETITSRTSGVSSRQIARETELPAEVLVGIVRMLIRAGYVTRIAPRAYAAGPALRLLQVTDARRALHTQLQRTLAIVRDIVGAAVYLSRYLDGEVHITQYADGPLAPKVREWVEFRFAAHATAVGKCLLAQLDLDSRRDHLSRHKVARLTSKTITSTKELFTALDSQSATAPFFDRQEYAIGTVCAAVPITLGRSTGALALSLPISHAHRLDQAAEALNQQAAAVLLTLLLTGEHSPANVRPDSATTPEAEQVGHFYDLLRHHKPCRPGAQGPIQAASDLYIGRDTGSGSLHVFDFHTPHSQPSITVPKSEITPAQLAVQPDLPSSTSGDAWADTDPREHDNAPLLVYAM